MNFSSSPYLLAKLPIGRRPSRRSVTAGAILSCSRLSRTGTGCTIWGAEVSRQSDEYLRVGYPPWELWKTGAGS